MPTLSGTARSRATSSGIPRAVDGSFAGKTAAAGAAPTVLPGQTWAKTNPTAQTWAKVQPTDQTWAKTQPADQTWSVT